MKQGGLGTKQLLHRLILADVMKHKQITYSVGMYQRCPLAREPPSDAISK